MPQPIRSYRFWLSTKQVRKSATQLSLERLINWRGGSASRQRAVNCVSCADRIAAFSQ